MALLSTLVRNELYAAAGIPEHWQINVLRLEILIERKNSRLSLRESCVQRLFRGAKDDTQNRSIQSASRDIVRCNLFRYAAC